MASIQEHDPVTLRTAMVASLRDENTITSERVAAAFTAVPRRRGVLALPAADSVIFAGVKSPVVS